ncbi:MAG: DUF861 domain-containing protein [Gammaproteobacteria bacterium]|nr:DUF861 domain-containing protein [Gammaproteobacteria bacterium]
MINYSTGMTVAEERFQAYDTKEGGALETDGDLKTEITIDFENDKCLGGIFRQVKGKAEIVWPATEHAFVLEGEVTIHHHESGEKQTYKVGDGWIIDKGERVTWEVTTPTFRKSFFLSLAQD